MYYLTTINANGFFEYAEQETCPDLAQLRQAVGGYIETVPYWEHWDGRQAVAFCNEEGKLEGLPINANATSLWHSQLSPRTIDDVLCGNVIIISADTGAEMREL
jgi:hypothetical protein